MKLTRSVSYAVGVLLNVEPSGPRQTMTAARISEGCEFPPRFLYRILRRLVDSGLLKGVSGPGGGYQLARPASKITLLQIVEAVEGEQKGSRLPPVCKGHAPAMRLVNAVCASAAKRFSDELSQVTLAKLSSANRSGKKKGSSAAVAKRKPKTGRAGKKSRG